MNKLPAKQIYLLFIIVVGIIALSVYSTYALFTYESSTSDIVSIHIPKSLTISENIYEYQQITVAPNSTAATDIDIYNSFENNVCYSIWYKVIGNDETQNKVQVFEKTDGTLTSSGVLDSTKNIRVTLAIVNDNESEVKINIGTMGSQNVNGNCALNISSDKSTISTSYKNIDILTTKLINEEEKKEITENYLTYKDSKDIITFKNTDKVYTANEFTYNNELFTLTSEEYITIEELINKNLLGTNDIYICKDNSKCSVLYKVEIENIIKNDALDYQITKYDKLIGYQAGENGLRKINKDYVYYGDNPNNFIYYNCENNDDLNTCELWRIVGFFYNEKTGKYNTKIVRNNSIGTQKFDYKFVNEENQSSNDWNESTINKYLNEEYKLINNSNVYLDSYSQQIEIIPDLEATVKDFKSQDTITKSKISLLSLSDFINTSSCEKAKINEYTKECLTNNWLNNLEITSEWTMTAKEVEEIIEEIPVIEEENVSEEDEVINESENNEENITGENQNEETTDTDETTQEEIEEQEEENKYVINYVYTIGNNILEKDINESHEVRPVVFLKSRMLLLDGNGSLDKPYIVK